MVTCSLLKNPICLYETIQREQKTKMEKKPEFPPPKKTRLPQLNHDEQEGLSV